MTENIASYGQVQTVKNGVKVQHKEYGLHYDGMNMDIAIKDAVNNQIQHPHKLIPEAFINLF